MLSLLLHPHSASVEPHLRYFELPGHHAPSYAHTSGRYKFGQITVTPCGYDHMQYKFYWMETICRFWRWFLTGKLSLFLSDFGFHFTIWLQKIWRFPITIHIQFWKWHIQSDTIGWFCFCNNLLRVLHKYGVICFTIWFQCNSYRFQFSARTDWTVHNEFYQILVFRQFKCTGSFVQFDVAGNIAFFRFAIYGIRGIGFFAHFLDLNFG